MSDDLSRVVVFQNVAPVSRDELISDPAKLQVAEPFLQFFDIPDALELTGEWWGVIHPAAREFHKSSDEQSAIALGMRIAQTAQAELWYVSNGHSSARLVADYRSPTT